MPEFKGKFEYLIDGKKVTQEQFQQLVDNNEKSFNIEIDNLRVVAKSKVNPEPFFLDEFLYPAQIVTSSFTPNPTAKEKEKLEKLRGYLVEGQQFNNLGTIVKIFQAESEEELKSAVKEDKQTSTESTFESTKLGEWQVKTSWTPNSTGGTVFEKVQDSTLPQHPKHFDLKTDTKKYSVTLDCKLPTEVTDLAPKELGKVWLFSDNLDTYNDIVGHSTRHKVDKDLRNDVDNQTISSAIMKHVERESPLLSKSPVINISESARQINENFGKKETEGKLHYEISWRFIQEMAKRMANNKSDKYPLYNWKKQIDVQDLKDAINRHHIEVMDGNYRDGNEVLGHVVSYACNAMMLWEQLKNKDK